MVSVAVSLVHNQWQDEPQEGAGMDARDERVDSPAEGARSDGASISESAG